MLSINWLTESLLIEIRVSREMNEVGAIEQWGFLTTKGNVTFGQQNV